MTAFFLIVITRKFTVKALMNPLLPRVSSRVVYFFITRYKRAIA